MIVNVDERKKAMQFMINKFVQDPPTMGYKMWETQNQVIYLLNPSRDARMISPGKRPKNFFPAFELATELVMSPETLTTPERTPVATFSVICVTLLTLLHRN